MQGIYRILNLITGMWYVGSASSIRERWGQHKKALRRGCDSPYLQNALNKYGAKNFLLEILEEVKGSRRDAFDQEQKYLDEWFSTGQLYNISPVAGGGPLFKGHRHTEEAKTEIGERSKESWTPERREEQSERMSGEGNPMYGPGSEEAIAKICKIWTPERKRRRGERYSGEGNPNYGNRWNHTEETKTKIGKKAKEGWTPERKREQSKRMSGEGSPMRGPGSEEAIAKISKPYPAFYNVRTGGYIPSGVNLYRLCQQQGLNAGVLWHIQKGNSKQTRDGWRLATEAEISNET